MAGEPLETTPAPLDALAPSEQFNLVPTFDDVAPAEIYPMLQLWLREIDEKDGSSFLKRYLKRPEDLYARMQQKLWRLTLLTDVERVPDSLLPYLLAEVGFGEGSGRAWEIARRLDAAHQRKLLTFAVQYWMRRGRRDALSDSIRSLTGAIPAIDDWFFMRFLVDEALLGVEGLPGTDPWELYESVFVFPGSPAPWAEGDMQVALRVPDENGLIDRIVVEDLCRLARPVGERYEIAYVQFLDTFIDGRLGHWRRISGDVEDFPGDSSASPALLPGFRMPVGSRYRMATPLAGAWADIVWTTLVNWRSDDIVRLNFYVQDNDNHYTTAWNSATGLVEYYKTVGGVDIAIASVNVGVLLDAPAVRGVRIDVQQVAGPLNLVRLYLDGDLILEDATDGAFLRGTCEYHNIGPGADIRIHRPEVWTRPLATTTIAP